MRISTSQIFTNNRNSVSQRLADFVQMQNQVSTGKKLNVMSDDPLGGSLVLKSRSMKSSIEQYGKNLIYAKDYLGNSETALTDVEEKLRTAYQVALQGAGSTTTQDSRNGLASQIASIQQKLVDLANSQSNSGSYLFAGQKNDQKPYSVTGGVLVYSGNSAPIMVETAPGKTMKVNTDGGQPFVDAYAALESLRNNLLSGNGGAISGIDIQELLDQQSSFGKLRGDVGAALQNVTEQENANLRRMDELTSQISDIEDVDLTEAVSGMQEAQVAYQAALQVSASSFRLSLMDYMQ